MPRIFYIVLCCAVLYILWTHWFKPTPNLAQMPQSQQIAADVRQIGDYTIRDLESYQGEFRILSREEYSLGTEAQFSPVDFAVGWGPMAQPENYSKVSVSQSNRWYHWQTDAAPIPLRDIETHSANMHIIPANAAIAKQIQGIKKGDMVYLKGALVEIERKDGWKWRSSLSREDTGAGACEVMRVDQVLQMAG